MSKMRIGNKLLQNNEDSIFNSKLFLNINDEFLNNSFSKELENFEDIEDINNTSFLTKELIDELNFSNLDICLKKEQSFNDSKLFLSLIKAQNKNNPRDYINNIQNNRLLFNNFNYLINNKTFPELFFDNLNYYNYRKIKLINDRKKDWICQICRNLNYSFRTECNRCKLPKERCIF
jgi:hypothetical protein